MFYALSCFNGWNVMCSLGLVLLTFFVKWALDKTTKMFYALYFNYVFNHTSIIIF